LTRGAQSFHQYSLLVEETAGSSASLGMTKFSAELPPEKRLVGLKEPYAKREAAGQSIHITTVKEKINLHFVIPSEAEGPAVSSTSSEY
jgi:hypothetical protein